MTALRRMIRMRLRVLGLVLLVGIVAGCSQRGDPEAAAGTGTDNRRAASFVVSLSVGLDALKREDFATAAETFAWSAALARTDKNRARALVFQAGAELLAGRLEMALETAKRSEIALQRSDVFDSKIYTLILKTRARALLDLGREAEAGIALEDLRLYAKIKAADLMEDTPVDPDSGPVPHDTIDMTFLPRIGDMQLRQISRSKSGGSDMAGHYGLIPPLDQTVGPFEMSVFVTQRPSGDPHDEMAVIVKMIKTDKSDARVVTPVHRVSVTTDDGTRAAGWRVVLLIPSFNAYTEALLFKARGAVVKINLFYPVPAADAMLPLLRIFLAKFDWPPVDPAAAEQG